MKKSILNLAGAQELSRNDQKEVNGGLCRGMYLVHGSTEAVCIEDFGFWLGGTSNTCRYGSC